MGRTCPRAEGATRNSEKVMPLKLAQLKFDSSKKPVTMELAGEDTKTGESRMVIMGGDLNTMLATWYKDIPRYYPRCEWVVHFKGRRLTSVGLAIGLCSDRIGTMGKAKRTRCAQTPVSWGSPP